MIVTPFCGFVFVVVVAIAAVASGHMFLHIPAPGEITKEWPEKNVRVFKGMGGWSVWWMHLCMAGTPDSNS